MSYVVFLNIPIYNKKNGGIIMNIKFSKLFFILSVILIFTGCNDNSEKIPEVSIDEGNDLVIIQSQEETINDIIFEKIESMTLEEKTGQLFMCAFRKDNQGIPITKINENIISVLDKYKIGGVIFFAENIDTEEQTKKFIEDLQNKSTIPLLVGVDEEGGRVSRLKASGKIKMDLIPPALEIGTSGDLQKAYDYNLTISNKLKELGFNIDFAPVADINTNPENTVIGDRAYGTEPEQTGNMVAQAVKGLIDGGVKPVLKHFPGHGDTLSDTHKEETYVNHDIERLETTELIPFKKGIEAGAEFVMISHIKMPNITNDNLPASFSKDIINGILRQKLEFDGIVITDALDMGAITNYYTPEEIAVKAVDAGVDILLMPENLEASYNAVINAVKNGDILEERLNESVKRILISKYSIGYEF